MKIDLIFFSWKNFRNLQNALEHFHSEHEDYPLEECQWRLWQDIKNGMRENLVPVATYIQDGWPIMLCVSEKEMKEECESLWLTAVTYQNALTNNLWWSSVWDSKFDRDFTSAINDVKKQISLINNGDMPRPSDYKDNRATENPTGFEEYYAKETLRIKIAQRESDLSFMESAKRITKRLVKK